jgi:hypothetical protein
MSSAALTFGTCEVPFCDIQEFHREIVHLRCKDFHAVRQQVVLIAQVGNRREQPACRRDERVGDRPRDDAKVRRTGLRDVFECQHDADDGAEESDERRNRRCRRQKADVLLELVDLDHRRAHECPVHAGQAL